MPVYEYECTKCGHNFEIIQKFNDAPLTMCSSCGGSLKKLISNTSFVLKGTGWYVTDYASPERKKAMESEKEIKKESASDTKTQENKAVAQGS